MHTSMENNIAKHFKRLKCKRQIFNPVQLFIMHMKMQVTKFIKQYLLEFFEAFLK